MVSSLQPRPPASRRRTSGLLAALAPALVVLASLPVRAIDLGGQTWFVRPPWKVETRNYYWYVMQTGGEYYFTVTLPEEAGTGLGGRRR